MRILRIGWITQTDILECLPVIQQKEMYQWKTHTVLASIDQTMMHATGVRHYGGIRRLPYLGIIFGLGIPQNVIVARMASVESMQPLVFGVVLLFVVVSFVRVYYRLQNIGMNPWWCLLMIVPIANLCGQHTLPDLPGGIRGHEETRYGR